MCSTCAMRASSGRVAARLCLAAVGLLLCGCASTAKSRAWLEVNTAHYQIYTDLKQPLAREMASTLEEVRRALLMTAWPGAAPTANRTQAVVFSEEEDFRGTTGSPNVSGQLSCPPGLVPLLSLAWDAQRPSGLPEDAVHEVAHDLDRWFSPLRPPWLREGMATYLEGISYEAKEQRLIAGGLPSQMERELRSDARQLLPMAELLSAPTTRHTQSGDVWRFYFTSWLLTLWLQNRDEEAFSEFRRELAATYDWRRAFEHTYPALDEERLDRLLAEYMAGGRFRRTSRPMPPRSHRVGVRVLSEAQSRGVQAWAALRIGNDRLARIRAAQARGLEQDDFHALLTLFHLEGRAPLRQEPLGEARRRAQRRLELARHLVRSHPHQGEAWLALSQSTAEPWQRERALRRARALSPDHPGLREELARVALAAERPGEALQQTDWLLRRVAATPSIAALRVRALGLAGQCPRGARFAEAWLSLHSDESRDGRVMPGFLAETLRESGCEVSEQQRQRLDRSLIASRGDGRRTGKARP